MLKRRSKFNTSASDRSKDDRPDTDTRSDGGDEIRIRVNANAPLSVQFNGDMEGRTLRMVPGENGMAELIISGGRKEGRKEQRKEQVRHVMSSNQLSKNRPVTGMQGKAPHYPAKLYEGHDSEESEEPNSELSDRSSSYADDSRGRLLRVEADIRWQSLKDLSDEPLKETQDMDAESFILEQVSANFQRCTDPKFTTCDPTTIQRTALYDSDPEYTSGITATPPSSEKRSRYQRRIDWYRQNIRSPKTTASRPAESHSNLDDIETIPFPIPPRITTPTIVLYQKRNAAVEHASNTENGSKDNDTRRPRRQSSAKKAAALDKMQAGAKAKAQQIAKVSKRKGLSLSLDLEEERQAVRPPLVLT